MPPRRITGFSYTGLHRYALTFCTARRARAFQQDSAVALVLSQLRRTASAEGFAILAYCFMPDHLHVLVEATSEAADLRRFAETFKLRAGFGYARTRGHRLWQRGYYDHVVRDEESVLKLIRYIVTNPIRAGLVTRVEEYPHAGSDVYPLEALLEDIARRG